MTSPARIESVVRLRTSKQRRAGTRAIIRWLSTPIHKYAYVRCAVFDLGLGATREHTLQRSVSEEQQRPKPNTAQPSGRQVFLRQTSLLAPYRPLRGMLVARASSGTKISCRERMRIYELEY